MNRKLYRTRGPDAILFGVCGGIAERFCIDPVLARAALVLLVCFKGLSLWLYLLAALLLPPKSRYYPEP
ncbi:PspC domain-containing protein [Pseudoflavonifractor sp. 524-17]|uniref:PspC domain-containing protein n=1 Tax=Pseudoflavonifractor sp. 524-17 TaxID=2304577 RepID=UPI0013794B54|nr:PspC domain-containing protein [Pseudoflavonifractor sp. 524-17]NCE63479.1 PspC domain-containing protein [Pseudoflavonifractor sp. 524-17]